jgi:hypothetical protein
MLGSISTCLIKEMSADSAGIIREMKGAGNKRFSLVQILNTIKIFLLIEQYIQAENLVFSINFCLHF